MANERKTEFSIFKVELDEKTEIRDHKKNRYNGYIKSIRVGRSSSPNAVFKVKLKEGDEINLWPGRIINLTERSEGAIFSWDALPNEWAEIEISENAYFVAGDYQGSSSGSSTTAKEFRKSAVDLIRYQTVEEEEVCETKIILSKNEKRIYAIIENPNPEGIFIGTLENISNAISGLIRRTTSIRIMPFSKKRVDLTGELYAIRDNAFSTRMDRPHKIIIEEYLG